MANTPPRLIIQRKFFSYLSHLSPKELDDFIGFARSGRRKLSAIESGLLTVASRHHPHYGIGEAQLRSELPSQPPLTPAKVNVYLSRLTEDLETRLVQWEAERDPMLKRQLLIRAHRRLFNERAFFGESEKLREELAARTHSGIDHHLHLFQVNAELFYHSHTPKYAKEVSTLDDMEENLELFHKGIGLRLFCQKISRSMFLSTTTENNDHHAWLEFSGRHMDLPFFRLYHNLLRFQIHKDPQDLQVMIWEFKEYNSVLDRRERAICIGLMINAINPFSIAGDETYRAIHFELLNYTMEHDLAVFDDEMSMNLFNNYCVVGSTLKKFGEVKTFMKKYSDYLKVESKNELIDLLECTIHYEKGKLKEGYQKLNTVSFKNIQIRIRARSLQVKCLYELFEADRSYQETLSSQLNNFRRLIKNQKTMGDDRKRSYLNLISMIRKMAAGRHKRVPEKSRIKQELETILHQFKHPPVSRLWILERLEQWG